MLAEASVSVELWARYEGSGRVAMTVALALVACALLICAFRLRAPIRPPRFGRPLVTALVTLWVVSIVTFLVGVTFYVTQLRRDYPHFAAPQSPILPVTLSAAALTFVALLMVGRGRGSGRLVGAAMAALAAPMVFELPFDLMVMTRTTPPVLPHPSLWRLLFFGPLLAVELVTIALLLAVPAVRITSWTVAALAALFLTFTLWSSIGLGYPDHLLPHIANVVAKLCAFAVTFTMLLPRDRGRPAPLGRRVARKDVLARGQRTAPL